MTEALQRVLRFAFDVARLQYVLIDPLEHNTASLRLAERLGAKRLRTKVNLFGGRQVIYRLDRKVWYEDTAKTLGWDEPAYEADVRTCR